MTDDCSAGFMMTVLPVTSAAAVMPREDRQREIPRRDDDGDAARLVEVAVVLAGHVAVLRRAELQHLERVVVAEVDRLGDVGVGLAPRLAALVDDPRGQLEAALRGTARRARQSSSARSSTGVSRHAANAFRRDATAAFACGTVAAATLPTSSELVRRIDAVERLRDRLRRVVDHERVRAAELLAYLGQRRAHRGAVRLAREVGERFVVEWLRRASRR